MPLTLDYCITGIFTPGNIGADAGHAATPSLPTLVDPGDYDPAAVEYSLDFTKFYNAFYAGAV